MKAVAVALLILFTYVSGSVPVRAADSCKDDCRDYQRACLKAHTQAACKSEYDICMKHCKEK
jgi:hypothetical protein